MDGDEGGWTSRFGLVGKADWEGRDRSSLQTPLAVHVSQREPRGWS